VNAPLPAPRIPAAAQWALGVAALLIGAALAWRAFGQPPADLAGPGPDVAPLWLGGWALWKGLDPADPAVQQWLWDQKGSGLRPGQFFMPYPATAALLAMPLAYVPWDQLGRPLWLGCAVALVLAALAAPALSGRRVSGPGGLVAAGAGLSLLSLLDVVHHSLEIGQINAIVVGITVLGGALLARDRPVLAGAVLALGAGLKLFPGVVLVAAVARRRWWALGSAALVGGAIALATARVHPGWNPLDDLSRAWLQVTIGQAHRDPPLWDLWKHRGLVFGALTLGSLVALRVRIGEAEPVARRRLAAAVVVALAFGAGEAGGLAPPHEVLLVAPALLALLAPVAGLRWRDLAVTAALLALVWSPLDRYPADDLFSQDHGIWLIAAVWGLALWRVVRAARAPHPVPPEVR
jgi:hypothetical protein